MKNKLRVIKQNIITEKPAKAEVSDKDFRRKLKEINKWRKERLAEIRIENSR